MIAVNENIKELYKSDSVPKQYQISIYRSNLGALFPADDLYPSDTLFPLAGGEADVVIENDRIVNESVSFRQSICDSGDIIFGKCNAAELVFKCADVNNLFVGDELLVRQYIGGEYVSMGAYYITSIQKSADRRFRTITAYDRMTFFDRNVADWYNGLWVGGTTSITLGALRNSLCNYCGVPVRSASLVNDSMTVKKTMVPTEISGRDIIESICEINGVFGIIDNEGFFTFISLNTDEAVEEIPIGIRKSLEHEDYTVSPINALVIRQESNDIGASVGEGDNPYIIQGNFLVYGKSSAELTTIATNVFNAISNITYVPVRLQCRGLPYIEPGDCIEIEMQDGSYIKTLVLSRSLSGVQSLTDDITASGSEKRVETYGLSKSIIQIQGKANILERTVEENRLRVEDLEQGYSEITQTFDNLTFDVDNGESSSVLTLKAGETTLASAEIEITGMVTFSDLSGTGTSVINGSNITTGTITSANYQEFSGTVINGMKIDLSTGAIISKNFKVATNGDVEIVGTINAVSGVIGYGGDKSWTIDVDSQSGNARIYHWKATRDLDTQTGIYFGTDGIAIGAGLVEQSSKGPTKIDSTTGVITTSCIDFAISDIYGTQYSAGRIARVYNSITNKSTLNIISGNTNPVGTADGGIRIDAAQGDIGMVAGTLSISVFKGFNTQANMAIFVNGTLNITASDGFYVNGSLIS